MSVPRSVTSKTRRSKLVSVLEIGTMVLVLAALCSSAQAEPQFLSPADVEASILQAYEVYGDYTVGSGKDLDLVVTNFEHVPSDQFPNFDSIDFITPRGGDSIAVGFSYLESPSEGERAVSDPRWIERQRFVDTAAGAKDLHNSLADSIAAQQIEDRSGKRIVGATRYSVQLTLDGAGRNYVAAFFWVGRSTAEVTSLAPIDHVLAHFSSMVTLGLPAASSPTFLTDASALLAQQEAGGGGGRKSAGECTPWGPEVFRPEDEGLPLYWSDQQYHLDGPGPNPSNVLGSHYFDLRQSVRALCTCNEACTSLCHPRIQNLECDETIEAHEVPHILFEGVGFGTFPSPDHPGRGLCRFGAKCAAQLCETNVCFNNPIDVFVTAQGVTFQSQSGDTYFWDPEFVWQKECAPCGTGEPVAATVTATFRHSDEDVAPSRAVNVVLTQDPGGDGEVSQSVLLTPTASGAGFTDSAQFPQAVSDGAAYSVRANEPTGQVLCLAETGFDGFVSGPLDISLSCLEMPGGWCDGFPNACGGGGGQTGGELCVNWADVHLLSSFECRYTYFDSDQTVLIEECTLVPREIFTVNRVCTPESESPDPIGSTSGPLVYVRNREDIPLSGRQAVLVGVSRHDSMGVDSLRAFVDGQPVALSGVELGLPDDHTCSEVPSATCNANSGFRARFDTTQLTDGAHQLLIGVDRGDGVLSGVDERTIVIDNSNHVTLITEYVPSPGSERMGQFVDSEEPPSVISFHYDQALGSFERRPGGQCSPPVWNPTYVTHRIEGAQIDGCKILSSWDESGVEFTCPQWLVDFFNSGAAGVVNTDSYESYPPAPCAFTSEPHCLPGSPCWVRYRFLVDGEWHIRESRMEKQ